LGIIENLLQGIPVAADVSVEYIARQTAALVAADLVDLVDRARSASLERTILEW
jgi:peroxin-6